MSRRAILDVRYKGEDISSNISLNLLSFVYTDNEQKEADHLDIVMSANILGGLNFTVGIDSILDVGATLYDWNKAGEVIKVKWGRFAIDDIKLNSNMELTLSAISEKCATAFMKEKRSRTWESISIKEAIESIAQDNSMSVNWNSQKGTAKLDMLSQIDQTDADFIVEKVKNKCALKVKFNGCKIYVYQEYIKDSGLVYYPYNLSSYEFTKKIHGCYKACEVRYFNADNSQMITYRAEDSNINNDAVLIIDDVCNSTEEAKLMAEAKLKEANLKSQLCNFSIMGDINLFSGYIIELKKFGSFSGKYIIEKVTHTINSQGYVSNIECYLKR